MTALPDFEPLDMLQLFEPNPHAVYTIEETAHIAHVPRHRIAIYYKHGLISPTVDPDAGWFFNDESIRMLRRIEYLRTAYGLNVAGIKLVLELMHEVEVLSEEVRFLQRH